MVRRVGLETNTPFWNCILANAHFNYLEPTDATLHLQVYGTLAYGGRGIQYFTYYTPHVGNYRMGALDPFGNKTATWDMLRRVNLELHALAPAMHYSGQEEPFGGEMNWVAPGAGVLMRIE